MTDSRETTLALSNYLNWNFKLKAIWVQYLRQFATAPASFLKKTVKFLIF